MSQTLDISLGIGLQKLT